VTLLELNAYCAIECLITKALSGLFRTIATSNSEVDPISKTLGTSVRGRFKESLNTHTAVRCYHMLRPKVADIGRQFNIRQILLASFDKQ
jgi:hypothetical protein